MKRFNAKVDKHIAAAISILFCSAGLLIVLQYSFIPIIILLLISLFIFTFLFRTAYYTTEEGLLLIKSGIITLSKIEINNIKTIRVTDNLISDPAPLLDRIEILYNKYVSKMISLANKHLMAQEVTQFNIRIKVLIPN